MKHIKHLTGFLVTAVALLASAPAFAEDGWFVAKSTPLHSQASSGTTIIIESPGPPFYVGAEFSSYCWDIELRDDQSSSPIEGVRCHHQLLGMVANIDTITLRFARVPATLLVAGTGVFDGVTGRCDPDDFDWRGFKTRCEWSRS